MKVSQLEKARSIINYLDYYSSDYFVAGIRQAPGQRYRDVVIFNSIVYYHELDTWCLQLVKSTTQIEYTVDLDEVDYIGLAKIEDGEPTAWYREMIEFYGS